MVHKRHGRQQLKFASVVRGCKKEGLHPFSSRWGSCMKAGLKGRVRTRRKVRRHKKR